MAEPTLNDLSLRVGSLTAKIDNLEAAVIRLVDSQTKVVENFSIHSVSSVQFEEYRKTMHERFNHIHNCLGALDEQMDKVQRRVEQVDRDGITRNEALLMRCENLVQIMQLKLETRLTEMERLTSEWKGGLRATHSIAFILAATIGSFLGYLGEIVLQIFSKH